MLCFRGRMFSLDFGAMRVCDLEFDRVRRLTTPAGPLPAVSTNPGANPSCHTVWKYYCRDNFGWREYSEVTSPHPTPPTHTRFCLTSISFIPSAGGEAHRGSDPEGSEGGAIHYAPKPVHPQHQRGLSAERHLRIQASDQEAAHVHVSGDADASSTVSQSSGPCVCCCMKPERHLELCVAYSIDFMNSTLFY